MRLCVRVYVYTCNNEQCLTHNDGHRDLLNFNWKKKMLKKNTITLLGYMLCFYIYLTLYQASRRLPRSANV